MTETLRENNRGFPLLVEKIFQALSERWSNLFENKPDWGNVKVCRIRAPGATSKQFSIIVPTKPYGEQKFFIKQYASKGNDRLFWENQLKTDFLISKLLNKETLNSRWLKVIRPVAMLPEQLVLISEFIDGQNLGHFFSNTLRFSKISMSSFEDLKYFVNCAGRGLAEMQSLDSSTFYDILGRPNLDRYLEWVYNLFNDAFKILEKIDFNSELINRGRKNFERILATISPDTNMCFQHNDFILHNFIVDPQKNLKLFDFPNAKFGLPYFDVAHFISALEDFSYLVTVSKKRVSRLIRDFLWAYSGTEKIESLKFDAYRLLIQFISTALILKRAPYRGFNIRSFVYESPLKRFNCCVSEILKAIEKAK